MNIDGIAEDFLGHRGAFNMPAGPAWPPRAVPCRFARLRSLPERKIGGMSRAAVCLGPGPGKHLFEAATAQFAIVFVASAVEIDVAIKRVSKPLFDQRSNNVLHFFDVLCRVRKVIDSINGHCLKIVKIILSHLFSQSLNRDPFLVGPVDQLVVNVSDIDDPCDFVVTVRQIPFDRIKNYRPDHVADMSRFVDSRTAQIHAHLARFDGLKVFLLS